MTSAEAVLISLQSHSEVLHALDSALCLAQERLWQRGRSRDYPEEAHTPSKELEKVFVASVSPQVRASLAATYGITQQEAGWMIEQLLGGPNGLKTGGKRGNGFTWIIDTNSTRELGLVLGAEEVLASLATPDDTTASDAEVATTIQPKKPVLTSACPGWICYAEKTHTHILPHLSRLKSPQALTGTLVKTVLSHCLNIDPSQIWHLAIMPCFDKKLEASREELTNIYWRSSSSSPSNPPIRDVDCVITARELLMLAETRSISFPSLPRQPLDQSSQPPFPDPKLNSFLFPHRQSLSYRRTERQTQTPAAGSSGGYLYHILCTQQSLHPDSSIHSTRGRNADVIDYTLQRNDEVLFRAARYYGFRNIQNLVRKLKPAKKSRMPGGKMIGARKPGAKTEMDYAYVEVMACPGGCTNGGGQIKVEDVGALQGVGKAEGHKEWLARVDEAYYSMDETSGDEGGERDADGDVSIPDADESGVVNGISTSYVKGILSHWAALTGLDTDKLVYTSYRTVNSDVGKEKGRETERVVELAGKIGGGW